MDTTSLSDEELAGILESPDAFTEELLTTARAEVDRRRERDDAPQTAMLLTEDEWADLAAICKHYLGEFPTPSSLGLDPPPGGLERWVVTDRRRSVAQRVVAAAPF